MKMIRRKHNFGLLGDGHGRRITHLRLAINDRYEARCPHCASQSGRGAAGAQPAEWLDYAELAHLVGLLARLGVSNVRLTGGEPLLRPGLAELAGRLSALEGVHTLSLSTAGRQLARHAAALKAAGVRRLNVALSTLDAASYCKETGADALPDVLDGLAAARREGFAPIKINCTVRPDASEAALARMLAWTLASGFILRLIDEGSFAVARGERALSEMAARVAGRFGLIAALDSSGLARYWTAGEDARALGVIGAQTRQQEAAFNRVYMTPDGTLHMGAASQHRLPLGAMLRGGADDADLMACIVQGAARRPLNPGLDAAPLRLLRLA